ncbi:MAG TPA: amidohydrolase family protein [Vicinamibacterales bacterium]|jgi:Tol biopolymer transport system component/imidazolonepropionase-like amidohydrolase
MQKILATVILVISGVLVGRGQQAAPRPVHLALTEGTNMAAALSPDGRTIAIDLLGTLWTLPAQGGAATAITDIFLDARQPSWSPDGRRLAFQAYRDTTWQIWTANADGTDLKPVTSSAFDDREPAWSPDGTRVAFSSDRSGSYDVWIVTLATGAVQQITTAASNEYMPSWRSATDVGYVSDRRDKPGIYVAPATTTGATETLVASADGALAAPAFGPDGAVAFNAIAGSHSRLMVGDRNVADSDEDVFPFRPQWLPNNELLYTADGKIKRRPATGGAARPIEFSAAVSFTRPAFTPKRHRFDLAGPQPVRGIMHPAVSPDGRQVAFAALGDLWVMPVDGAPRRLTTDPALDTDPAWSPDGTSLAYCSDRSGAMNIWIADVESAAARQLTHLTAAATLPAWSPDASRLAFVDADGQLQVVDVKSGAVRKIHDHLNEPGRPSWSPDGSAVVVSSLKVYSTRFREGTNQVLRVPLDGSGDRWFDPSPHKSIGMREDSGPIWSPDGTQMAAIVDGLLTAWPVGRDGAPLGPPRPLSSDLAGSPTWTGDSRQILYQTDAGLTLVDVGARRTVRAITPRLTWTQAPPRYVVSGSSVAERTKTIHAGRLWDGRSDALQRDVDIVLEGNRITSVEPHRDGRPGTLIDASNETVIPGLIEIHTHLSETFGEALGRAFLSWGITTVRNPATNSFETMEFREAFESGARVGPRLITTGEPFDGTRIYYPGGTSLGDTGQVPLELQHAQDFGYDFIKTYVRLPDLMQKRIIEAAHAMGMPVTSHELYPAVAYGADGVEHIRGTSRRGYSPKITALTRSYRDVIDLLTASKMTLTPTIGIQGGFRLQTLRDASWIDDPRMQKLYPPSVVQRWRDETRTPASAATLEEAQRLVTPQERTVYQVVRGGGRVTAGTDSPINPYGLSLLMELENYASGGLTPVEVLRTATMVSADAMGVGADIGSIEPGKLADLTFIDGDPLQHIADLVRVRRVIKDGNLYDVSSLVTR